MPKAAPARKAKSVTKDVGGKKKKDPNAPKRGLSAYMFFANETRDKVRADHPNMKFGDVGKKLGSDWKSLTAAQKAPFEKKAADDKKRYEAEKAAYQSGAVDDDEEDE